MLRMLPLVAAMGFAMRFPAVVDAVAASVPPVDVGAGAGTNNAFNAMRGALGIAVLAAVFAAHGGCTTPASLADGFRPAAWVGAAVASSDW